METIPENDKLLNMIAQEQGTLAWYQTSIVKNLWRYEKPFLKTLQKLESTGFSHHDISKAKTFLSRQ